MKILANFLLLLPILESVFCSVIVKEYSVKQVKIDDDTIKLILSKIYPNAVQATRSKSENCIHKPKMSFTQPVFENMGQKRFKKVNRFPDKEKFTLLEKTKKYDYYRTKITVVDSSVVKKRWILDIISDC